LSNIPGIDEIAESSEYGFVFVIIAAIVSSFTLFYPIYFRRKRDLVRGLSETIRILESNESHKARMMFYSKYEKNEKVSKEELEKSAEKIRSDLLLIKNMLNEKAVPHKILKSMYAEEFVKIINYYIEFMDEFHPDIKVEPKITKLYKNSYRWNKINSKNKVSKIIEGEVENMWDKMGL